jgi:predicted nuclease of predicted toxin-antitoxin system
MKILVDRNLSPVWVSVLNEAGHEAIHWIDVGSPSATDRELLSWAKSREYSVFTHDLDFGAILAVTHAEAPSVIQLRAQDITPIEPQKYSSPPCQNSPPPCRKAHSFPLMNSDPECVCSH